ncbi:MAG TPA: fused MFS/spermidine synthase [Thermoanaerobaculia bacterium]
MTHHRWKVAGLLFFSGMCALVYQTAWLRQFRLIFGASTFATGAVLAIFMAGLGLGSALLGRRADREERPLAWYAKLELLIALSAAVSPLLLWLVAKIYFAVGGSLTLGLGGASVVRLLLAVLVLAVPTILMGGTLPAAARAAETGEDGGRRAVALLYGINTLGAVAGALLSTFYLLELFGNRQTLFAAVLVNLLVALVARSMSASGGTATQPPAETTTAHPIAEARVPRNVVYASAAIVGFAFLLMELVWYRLLSPILGGTTYMFGLILAIALFGIGTGGAAYALLRGGRRATAGGFALTCSLEALAIVIPFAVGDRLAIFTTALHPLGVLGFGGHLLTWTIVTFFVVFPAAFISGIQFPLLIALLGTGRENVGRQVGAAYAWNTAGAIAGSLAGGFGLMPLLTAPGCWRLVAALLAALGLFAATFALRERSRTFAFASLFAAVLTVAALFANGPSAVWRHAGIGVGRGPVIDNRNEVRQWMTAARRGIIWEAEGRESSVALSNAEDMAFIVNGKSDGAARGDAGTQIMCGFIGAMLHPRPSKSLVIGLGTGSSAGWLARVPTMKRVDVVELEPAVLEVARVCDPVNGGALRNPKLHVTIADAREVLLATRERYDLIASEPSNPYRAGVASLFTREFYEAVGERLEPGGMFLQWVQTYSIDNATFRTIYATLLRVFPYVEAWRTTQGDVVLVASKKPVVYDAALLRSRMTSEPYRTAVHNAWRVETAEGFVSRMIANDEFARLAAAEALDINTDDRTVIEFGFARTLATSANLLTELASSATRLGLDRPRHVRGALDWQQVANNRVSIVSPRPPFPPANSGDVSTTAMSFATRGDDAALPYIEALRQWQPVEAEAILGILRAKQNHGDEAAVHFERAFLAFRRDPWPNLRIMDTALDHLVTIGRGDRRHTARLYDAVSQPFAMRLLQDYRLHAKVFLAQTLGDCSPQTIAALQELEPNAPWLHPMLALRAKCYADGDASEQAWRDFNDFSAGEAAPLVTKPVLRGPPGSS